MFAEVKRLEKQLDENSKKIKQIIALAGGFIFLLTCWIWDLEEQKDMLISKVTSMKIKVAKCEEVQSE